MVTAANADEFVVDAVQQGWHVRAWIGLAQGVPVISEIRIRPANGEDLAAAFDGGDPPGPDKLRHDPRRPVPDGGLKKETLRRFQWGAIFDVIAADPHRGASLVPHGIDPDANLTAIRRPGRRGRDSVFYAEWADRYLTKCETSRRPVPDLAAEHRYEVRTIRGFLDEAVERGLLVRVSRGRAGGTLTPAALRLLNRTKGAER
jgi:hypothetical protein